MERRKLIPSSSQAGPVPASKPARLIGPVALATHSWGILVLSPSLGARETPPHTPANWRMSSIYTWLWECVTHGSWAPYSRYCAPQGPAPNKEGEKLCPALSMASETLGDTARPKNPTQGGRDMAHVLSDWGVGRAGARLRLQKFPGNSRQHSSMNPSLPCLAPPQATVLHQARWPRPQRLTSNAPAPSESLCLGKNSHFFQERMY